MPAVHEIALLNTMSIIMPEKGSTLRNSYHIKLQIPVSNYNSSVSVFEAIDSTCFFFSFFNPRNFNKCAQIQ